MLHKSVLETLVGVSLFALVLVLLVAPWHLEPAYRLLLPVGSALNKALLVVVVVWAVTRLGRIFMRLLARLLVGLIDVVTDRR